MFFRRFVNWLFPSAEDRRARDIERAIERAKAKCARYWSLKTWQPFTIEWIEGDAIYGGIPYKHDPRWLHPYGGLYHLDKGKIVMVELNGRWSVRVLVHEICHYILDVLLEGVKITWHHTNLAWLVFGWLPEEWAKDREEGMLKTTVRRMVLCPKLQSVKCTTISPHKSDDTVIADCLTAIEAEVRR